MPLQPLPQEAITAARLRRMAADLILEAEALEASVPREPREKADVVVKRDMARIEEIVGKMRRKK